MGEPPPMPMIPSQPCLLVESRAVQHVLLGRVGVYSRINASAGQQGAHALKRLGPRESRVRDDKRFPHPERSRFSRQSLDRARSEADRCGKENVYVLMILVRPPRSSAPVPNP